MISICIVNWNTRDLLRDCLRSIIDNPPDEEYEIIVADNASPDASAQMVTTEFPSVILIANSDNLLYAKASNQAIKRAQGDLILLLNPDTKITSGGLSALAAFLREMPMAGAVAPKLISPDGSPQRSCRAFPTPRALLFDILGLARLLPSYAKYGEYRMTNFDFNSQREVDQPMASALMLKRQALQQIGGFDEGFPMFFNDVDLCLRLKQAGWKIYFYPEVQVMHHYGASTTQRKRDMIRASHASLLRFYKKHYLGRTGWFGYNAVLLLSKLGKKLRILAASRTKELN